MSAHSQKRQKSITLTQTEVRLMQTNFKFIISLILICFVIVVAVSPVLAGSMTEEELYKNTFGTNPEEEEKDGNLISNYLAELLSNATIGLYDKLGILDPVQLIFG